MVEQLVDKSNGRYLARRRAADRPTGVQFQWSLIWIVLGAFALSAKDWNLAGVTWAETLMVPLLAALCLWPLYQWYCSGVDWLPLGEAYMLMTFLFYGLPALHGNTEWLATPPMQRFLILLAVGIFLLAFFIAYRISLYHRKLSFRAGGVLLAEIRMPIIWWMFSCWMFWNIVIANGWLPDVGTQMNVFQSVVAACGTISIVYLFYQLGLRELAGFETFILVAGTAIGLLTNMVAGFLVGGAMILLAALFAFTLGRKQVPVFTAISCLVFLAFLHLGKGEYRSTYWDSGKNYGTDHSISLIEKYSAWFDSSWKRITSDPGKYEEQQDLFQRASLLGVLATVMDSSPSRLPYLNGITYVILPDMLMPRYFWPDKPRGSLPTEFLAVTYGLQTAEATNTTSITVGPVAEAWANFGWYGFPIVGAFFGFLYGIPARLSSTMIPRQIGWLLASVFLIYSVDVSHSVVEICCSLLQALLMGTIVLILGFLLLYLIGLQLAIKPGVKKRFDKKTLAVSRFPRANP